MPAWPASSRSISNLASFELNSKVLMQQDSIVIPAFEEAKKIAHDMQVAAQFLHDYNFAGEIIVVDDGSGDNTTNIARQAADQLPANVTSYSVSNNPPSATASETTIV